MLVPALTVGYLLTIRRHRTTRIQVGSFLFSMALVWAVSITPIETIALHYLLSVHLLQNVVLAEWAPLFLVLGIPATLAAVLPRVPPVAALLAWLVNYGAWHLPWVYDTALRHPHSLLHLEHALYFSTGVLLWWPVVHGRHAPGFKAGYLFAAFLLASPIGLLMALIPTPIYDFYAGAPERLWGLSRLSDQQIAGGTMALEQSIVFFAAFAVFFLRFLREQDVDTREATPADP